MAKPMPHFTEGGGGEGTARHWRGRGDGEALEGERGRQGIRSAICLSDETEKLKSRALTEPMTTEAHPHKILQKLHHHKLVS